MKLFFKPALAIIALTTLFACNKEVIPKSVSSQSDQNAIENAIGTRSSKWMGLYVEGFGNGIDTVADNTFIGNGVAQLTLSPYSYYYTNIQLPFTGRKIIGDSVRLETSFKNPSSSGIPDYDATLSIVGSKGTAHVTFIGYRQQYTSMGVGSAQISNIPELIKVFEDFTTVAMEIKSKNLSVYQNGVLTKSIFLDREKVGKILNIQISFKGSGTIDWAKMYNSYTNAQIMQEDFNGNKSSVIWY